MTPEMMLARALSSAPTEGREKTASAATDDATEKVAVADRWGRELAVKTAALGTFGKAIGTGMKALTTSTNGTRAMVGAGVGAVGGAARGTGYDQNGQKRSVIGNMVGGAALGAGMGVGAGYAARGLGSMNNSAGKYLLRAQKGVSAGNEQSLAAIKQMRSSARASTRPAVAPKPAPAAGEGPGFKQGVKNWWGGTAMGPKV